MARSLCPLFRARSPPLRPPLSPYALYVCIQGEDAASFKAEWVPVRSVLRLTVTALLPRGHSVHLHLARSVGVCVPPTGVTWPVAKEEHVGAYGGWYYLVLAEDLKAPTPEWAHTLRLSSSS